MARAAFYSTLLHSTLSYCILLYLAALFSIVLHYDPLCYVPLYYAAFFCTILSTALHSALPCDILLNCSASRSAMLHFACVSFYSTVLHSNQLCYILLFVAACLPTMLHYNISHCILYFDAFRSNVLRPTLLCSILLYHISFFLLCRIPLFCGITLVWCIPLDCTTLLYTVLYFACAAFYSACAAFYSVVLCSTLLCCVPLGCAVFYFVMHLCPYKYEKFRKAVNTFTQQPAAPCLRGER